MYERMYVCMYVLLNAQDKLLAANACKFLGIDRHHYETDPDG